MWQMVGYVPTTLSQRSPEDITLLSAKLATSFFLKSFIHAKEKLNIVQWVEFLTKQVGVSSIEDIWYKYPPLRKIESNRESFIETLYCTI